MNLKKLAMAMSVGIGAVVTLLWLLGTSHTIIAAEPIRFVPSAYVGSPETRILDETPIHYVAVTGNDSGDCSTPTSACQTIQYAVDQTGKDDEIRVAAGRYSDVSVRPRRDVTTTGVVTQVAYISKTVAVRGGYTTTNWGVFNPISYPTTLDAQGRGRVFYITGDISPTIEGLRITGGDATGLGGHGRFDGGAGMYIITATAFIRDSQVFSNTSAWVGGGIYLHESRTTLSDNIVTDNTAVDLGGGLFLNYSDATLVGNAITFNAAAWGGYGGGLYLSYSDVKLIGNTVTTNTAYTFGGGMYTAFSAGIISDSAFAANSAWYGGGLFLAAGDFTLSGNTFFSNTASYGGGGLCLFADATLTNNVFADNQAPRGSGLYISSGASPHLMHTTIARNQGGDGSAVYITNGTAALTNTILVSNPVGIYVEPGSTAKLEATVWGSGAWANETDWGDDGTIITGTVNIWDDPAFVDPDKGDYHIGPDSAAIDTGVDAGVNDDIDGETRPQGGGYDIGADEYHIPADLEVIKHANPNPITAGQALTYTLRITNSGTVDLHATVTDVLPMHILLGSTSGGTLILPGGTLTWTPTITASGGAWMVQFAVTVELGYVGPLTNVVTVSTKEGATGAYTVTSSAYVSVKNQPPNSPSNPDPSDGATGVALTQTLSWQGGDPDGDPVTYSTAFGTDYPPPPVASDLADARYDPGELEADTIYHWVITASDGLSMTVGPVWSFETVAEYMIYLPVILRNK